MLQNQKKNFTFYPSNISSNKYINFVKQSNKPKKLLKFNSFINDKNHESLPKKSISDVFDQNSINEANSISNIISIFSFIINKLESLIYNFNKNNYDYIYSTLIKIKNAINKIISNENILEDNIIINKSAEENINEISSEYINIKNNSKRIKLLKKKNSDLEDKLKTEQLNYLLYINKQTSKIKELEQKLKQNSFDNMTESELKEYKCFPFSRKFSILDEYTQKPIIKNKFKSYKNKRNKKYLFELNNISENENNMNNIKEIIRTENDDYIDNQRKYYISHPKLKYIKGNLNMKSWKTNELLDSFPKELLKHKFASKSQKNNLIVFPSSINQIFADLEKLKIHNNFERIENEIKKTRNINY